MSTKNRNQILDFEKGWREVATTDFNRWVTGVALKHPPTKAECRMHFILAGGYRKYKENHPLTAS